MTLLDDLVKQGKLGDSTRDRIISSAARSVLQSYSDVHKEIASQILEQVPEHASESQLMQIALTIRQNSDILQFIAARVRELDTALAALVMQTGNRLLTMVKNQAPAELRTLSLQVPSTFAPDPLVIESSLGTAVSFMKTWNSNYQSTVLNQLRIGATQGETYQQLAKRIQSKTTIPGGTAPIAQAQSHALMSVRWAMVRATNDARQDSYQQISARSDIEVQKMWFAAIDSCCRTCALLHAQVVSLDEDFPWRQLKTPLQPFRGELAGPPAHPNCRCRIIPFTADVKHLLPKYLAQRTARLAKLG